VRLEREVLIKKDSKPKIYSKFRFLRHFLIFKTIFEEIKTKPDSEKKLIQI